MGARSPVDVGIEVVAGLIAIGLQRRQAVDDLRHAVETAVRELDPHGLRDHTATWSDDHPWARPDAFDRFRRAFDDLLLLEAQAAEITDGLKSMLIPSAVKPSGVPTPAEAHARLTRIAQRRVEDLRLLELATRIVRPGLSPVTSAGLRRCYRGMRDEEDRARGYRERLGRLLAMVDLVDRRAG